MTNTTNKISNNGDGDGDYHDDAENDDDDVDDLILNFHGKIRFCFLYFDSRLTFQPVRLVIGVSIFICLCCCAHKRCQSTRPF